MLQDFLNLISFLLIKIMILKRITFQLMSGYSKDLNETQKKVIKHLKNYKFNLLVQELYHFIWNDFCDIYIELAKIYFKDKKILMRFLIISVIF